MTTPFEIPLSPSPQRFAITLSGTTYVFVFQFRNYGLPGEGGDWILDIGDNTGAPLVCGIPLVTGTNLLEQYDYLNFAGVLAVFSDGDPYKTPTFKNLGISSHVIWLIP